MALEAMGRYLTCARAHTHTRKQTQTYKRTTSSVYERKLPIIFVVKASISSSVRS